MKYTPLLQKWQKIYIQNNFNLPKLASAIFNNVSYNSCNDLKNPSISYTSVITEMNKHCFCSETEKNT